MTAALASRKGHRQSILVRNRSVSQTNAVSIGAP
jgi:hypothetical protein